ncbi:hypothetical protein R6Q59_033770 [Mikania micrantha]
MKKPFNSFESWWAQDVELKLEENLSWKVPSTVSFIIGLKIEAEAEAVNRFNTENGELTFSLEASNEDAPATVVVK